MPFKQIKSLAQAKIEQQIEEEEKDMHEVNRINIHNRERVEELDRANEDMNSLRGKIHVIVSYYENEIERIKNENQEVYNNLLEVSESANKEIDGAHSVLDSVIAKIDKEFLNEWRS